MMCIGGETAIVLATNQRISLLIQEQTMRMIDTQEDARGNQRRTGERLIYSHFEFFVDSTGYGQGLYRVWQSHFVFFE